MPILEIVREEDKMDKAVVWRREGNLAIMILDRPAEYNVINTDMAREFRQALLGC
jgi:enoyl-CoA hydratase/carnithine racemase